MSRRYTSEELYRLRNFIPIQRLIKKMYVPCQCIDGIFRFQCPACNGFHTATHPETNLGRCFDCKKNFNTIDLVMIVNKIGFVDAVKLLMQWDKTGGLL